LLGFTHHGAALRAFAIVATLAGIPATTAPAAAGEVPAVLKTEMSSLYDELPGKPEMASVLLGSLYLNGGHILPDPVAAESWFRRAAMAGNSIAAYILAVMYAEGVAVPQNRDLAVSILVEFPGTYEGEVAARADALVDRLQPMNGWSAAEHGRSVRPAATASNSAAPTAAGASPGRRGSIPDPITDVPAKPSAVAKDPKSAGKGESEAKESDAKKAAPAKADASTPETKKTDAQKPDSAPKNVQKAADGAAATEAVERGAGVSANGASSEVADGRPETGPDEARSGPLLLHVGVEETPFDARDIYDQAVTKHDRLMAGVAPLIRRAAGEDGVQGFEIGFVGIPDADTAREICRQLGLRECRFEPVPHSLEAGEETRSYAPILPEGVRVTVDTTREGAEDDGMSADARRSRDESVGTAGSGLGFDRIDRKDNIDAFGRLRVLSEVPILAQISTVFSPPKAHEEIDRLKEAYGASVLNGFELGAEPFKMKDGETVYRIIAYGFESRTEAAKFCSDIASLGEQCIVRVR